MDIREMREIRENRELREFHLLRKRKYYKRRNNPLDTLDDTSFTKIYRFSKNRVRFICNLIRNDIQSRSNKGGSISVELQVCIALRYFSKGGYQLENADIHGVSRQTVSRIVKRVSVALASKREQFISFPENTENLKMKFYEIARMPNIIGAIDGTHIRIKNPGGEYRDTYICRKGYHSLNVQVICDSDCKIMDIVGRWRGSTHDSRIWNECNFKTKCEAGEINGILLGDNGYPCSQYLLTPLLNPRPGAEARYNTAHVRTRGVVERLFGRLKMKFRAAYNTFQINLNTVKATIIAIAILHNMAVEDYVQDEEDELDLQPEQNYMDNLNNNFIGNLFRQNYIAQYFN